MIFADTLPKSRIIPSSNAGESKKNIVRELGNSKTICIGNGYNDIPMFKEAALSIAVIEKEGASAQLLLHADIVTNSINDALEILLNNKKIKATLRS